MSGPSRTVPRIVVGSMFVGAIVVIAAFAAWPIYRSWSLLILVLVASAVAAGIAALAWRRRWGGWRVTGALIVAVFVLGVPLAVPWRLGGPIEILRGLGEVAGGLVFAWKDLLTVDLPVGSYRNLLVPALVVFLVGTCVALLLAWREGKIAYAAAPVAAAMFSFGLFFGRTTVSSPLTLGPITFYAPAETVIGILGMLVTLLWLSWRSRDERLRSLRRAAVSSGVRVSLRPSRIDRHRGALGAGMIAVAVIAAAVVVPYAARGVDREVLRSAAGPELDVAAAVSPLAEYRSLFSTEEADEVLFTVTAEGALPDRVRIATLDAYDGETFRSGGTGAIEQSRFVRVPAELDAGEGRRVDAEVTIEALDGIWMPTIGRLQSVDFTGPRSPTLADSFYYRADAEAAVQTAGTGLTEGDAYRLRAVEPSLPTLASIEAPGAAEDAVEAPRSLRAWVDEHVTGSDGAALEELVRLLRERGYLSHALDGGTTDRRWMDALPVYEFQRSRSGHSLARIDEMFTLLLERENDPRAVASANYVAAPGDDEQFAVAVALIAREVGFPARVVLGARLSDTQPGLAGCDSGVCSAQDLSAWTEVQSAQGDWIPVEVTPQFTQPLSLDSTQEQDPQNVTEVRPDAVEEVVPPDPVRDDSAADDRADESAGLDLAWLLPGLRVAGVVLLVLVLLAGPFVIVIVAKSMRRRSRRTQGDPAERIAGGWEEWVDAAVDSGGDLPRAVTRAELADHFATPSGASLAAAADRAVFSDAPVSDQDADVFWRDVEHDRVALTRGRGLWRTIVTTVSLRSFYRHLAPAGARPRFAERGKRRAPQPAR